MTRYVYRIQFSEGEREDCDEVPASDEESALASFYEDHPDAEIEHIERFDNEPEYWRGRLDEFTKPKQRD